MHWSNRNQFNSNARDRSLSSLEAVLIQRAKIIEK